MKRPVLKFRPGAHVLPHPNQKSPPPPFNSLQEEFKGIFSQIRPNNGDIYYLPFPLTYCVIHHPLSESQYIPLSDFVLFHCQQLCTSFTAFSFFALTPTQCLQNRRTKLFMSQTPLTLAIDLLQISFNG